MIGSDSFARKGKPAGSSDRIAIPVAADRDKDREVAMTLVEDSGLDAVYSGTIADSWRQQPGAPAYSTDLTRDEMPDALAAADKLAFPGGAILRLGPSSRGWETRRRTRTLISGSV
ncbi:hypothetical protein [Mesorhizobium sp. A623]